ncbi:MAG TPA: hypothetical protein PKV21_05625 [bacterium]|nr:hypothetical protein [bacterium]HOM26968.1 hypothetical protein [bacterium]
MKNLLLILKGVSGIFFQSIILREIFSSFFGNELSFSIVISFYLSGGAIGSYLLRKNRNHSRNYILFTFFEIFFLIFFLIFLRIFSNIQRIFYISNLRFFIFSFFLSFFSGFFEGARFILLSFLYKEEKSSGKVYGLEGLGFLIGGLLFSFLLFFKINIFFLFFLSLILSFLTIFYFEKNYMYLSIFIIFLFLLPFSKKLDFKTNSLKYKGFKVVEVKDTNYNKLTVLNKGNQYILLSNGFQEFTSQPDCFSIKNIAFFSLAFSEKIEKVGIYGSPEILDEIKKYDVSEIYFFEIDKEKTNLIKNYFLKDLKNIIFVNKDLNKFLKEKKITFDAFIITNSQPMNLRDNYFLTDEFFRKIREFTQNLIIVLPGSYDYLGKGLLILHSSIYKTAKKYFKYDIVAFTYPMIAVFSNGNLKLNKNFTFDRQFFNDEYLKFVLDENKKNYYLENILSFKTDLNTLSNQFCLFSSLSHYFSQTSQKVGRIISNIFFKIYSLRNSMLLLSLSLFLISLLPFTSTFSAIVFTNGFSCLTFEIIFIFLFQIYYGFVYGFISGIIGIFMAGISLGSLLSVFKIHIRRIIYYTEIFHFLFYFLSVILIENGILSLFLIFFSGFLTGWEFGIVSYLIKKESIVDTTGKLYSIDLLGALFSSLFLPLFLIPAFGISGCLWLIVLLKFSNLFRLFLKRGV